MAHVAYETVASMSRMPAGHRVAPAVVLEWLERRFSSGWVALNAAATRRALGAAVRLGIRGGALYDGLIAATAVESGCVLISADRRAAPVYAALGAEVVYIDAV